MDAATVYANVLREMNSGSARRGQCINIVCFTEPNIDGNYLNEKEYSILDGIASNIQYVFEQVDEVIREAR
jgi:hypothetical protein